MSNKNQEEKVKAQFIFVLPFIPAILTWMYATFIYIIMAIPTLFVSSLPVIWTSFIDAIVVFFTTLGLEGWMIKQQEDDDKKSKR